MQNKRKRESNYILHTSGAGFSPLMFDFILHKDTYGAVDYRILYENDISYWYLTKKGNQQADKIGKKMFDDKFYRKVINDSEKLNDLLLNYQTSKLDKGNISKEFLRYIDLANNFSRLYRYFEQPFVQSLERFVSNNLNEKEILNYLSPHNLEEKAKLPVNKETKKVLEKLVEMGKMKLTLHKSAERFFGYEWPKIIDYIANKSKLSPQVINILKINEVKRLISGKIIDIERFKERFGGCAVYKKNGKWLFAYGADYGYWKNKIMNGQNREIVGKIAHKGVVRGKVVVFMQWVGTVDLDEGDILVTGMTNPQMVPFIKKAGAIVTDEGGITCHAAIIARELKKPCIIGTKNATQVLKDGDFVEVDAERGIVRIIK